MPPKTRERPGAETGATTQSNRVGAFKLDSHSTSEASPDTAVTLSRIETILDSILRSLAPLVGAR